MSAILAVLAKLFVSAFGQALADIFQDWLNNQTAQQLGAQKVETADARATAAKEAAYAQIATDAGRGDPSAAAGRLFQHTF